MWNIDPRRLMERLLGAGGENLTRFVDKLIRAEALRGGLSSQHIHTQVRVNVRDGGVDTHSEHAVPGDESGWLSEPTCWQYKAERAASITIPLLRREISKHYVKALLEDGCAYRLCIAGDVPPAQLKKWEECLEAEVRKIVAHGPRPRVVAVDKIAEWASRYPFIAGDLQLLPSDLESLSSWSRRATALTEHYTPVSSWSGATDALQRHTEFTTPTSDPCLVVQGESGVGKTRLVYETLRSIEGMDALVGYSRDEAVSRKTITRLINLPNTTALLVADECSLAVRMEINELLQGHDDRIRAIAIDNIGRRPASGSQALWLERIPDDTLRAILQANFPDVPADRQRRFADLSGGFIRFAADLCKRHHEAGAHSLQSYLPPIDDYLQTRLKDDLEAVQALSLFPRVGWRDEVAAELAAVSDLTSIPENRFHSAVDRIRESPGFVAIAGRFWYVTPAIVVNALFPRAWHLWISGRLDAAINSLPSSLLEGLLQRSKDVGGEGVRREVSTVFRDWIGKFTASDLTNRSKSSRLATLVETDPQLLLPHLRSLIEHADPQVLRPTSEDAARSAAGVRRSLVWLCERLVCFSEYFDDVEAILYRLATEETEPNLGNNASNIWIQLFRLYLSGTSTPFITRVHVLRRRVASARGSEVALTYGAIGAIFNPHPMRMNGPSIVSGQLPPLEWHPASRQEAIECYEHALDVLKEGLTSELLKHREQAWITLTESLWSILQLGLLDQLRSLGSDIELSTSWTLGLLEQADDFLHAHRYVTHDDTWPTLTYIQNIRDWVDSLRPSNFHGRLRMLVSRGEWDEAVMAPGSGITPAVRELASEILDEPSKLDDSLAWLYSEEARSANVLGAALGEADSEGIFIRQVYVGASDTGNAGPLRGYAYALARTHPAAAQRMMPFLDHLEASQPQLAFEIASAVGDPVDGMRRVLHLVDAGSVPTRFLSAVAYHVGPREPQTDELQEVLVRLTRAFRDGDDRAGEAGLSLLSHHIHFDEKDRAGNPLLSGAIFIDCAWELCVSAVDRRSGLTSHYWADVLRWLTPSDPARSLSLAASMLLTDDWDWRDQAASVLFDSASKYPSETMRVFGLALLDRDKGFMLQITTHRDLLTQLPADTVRDWLEETGVQGARKLARHLPTPYINDSGTPVVSPLLEYVLQEFEEDDDVFNNFCIGVHAMDSWTGDRSDRLLDEAEEVKKFLSHKVQRIREWAKQEVAGRRTLAEQERQRFEEDHLA